MRREAIFWFLFWRLYVFGHREVDALKVVRYYQNGVNDVILSNNAPFHASSNFQGPKLPFSYFSWLRHMLYSVILLAALANDLTILLATDKRSLKMEYASGVLFFPNSGKKHILGSDEKS